MPGGAHTYARGSDQYAIRNRPTTSGATITPAVKLHQYATAVSANLRVDDLALTLLDRTKIEVLAGMNLPSLIKLIDIRNKLPLEQAVKEAIDAGRKYMRAGSADLGAPA